jgi:hypothetical protein
VIEIRDNTGKTILATQEILGHLAQKDGRPWTGVIADDRSAMSRFASFMRSEFGIGPELYWFGKKQKRGYNFASAVASEGTQQGKATQNPCTKRRRKAGVPSRGLTRLETAALRLLEKLIDKMSGIETSPETSPLDEWRARRRENCD